MRLAAAFAATVAGFAWFCADCGRLWSFIALTTCASGFDWGFDWDFDPVAGFAAASFCAAGLGAATVFFWGCLFAEGLALFSATARLAGNAAVGVWAGGGGAVAATSSDIS